MKTNETKRMIWTSDLYYDEESIKDWWRGQCEFEANSADYRDLCARMGIDADKLTDAQISALETLVPAYRDKLMEREPDMDLWAEENAMWLDDQRVNLDMPLCGYVVAVENLGLWDRKRTIYLTCGDNLNSILKNKWGDCEAEFFADDYDVRGTVCHHDGTNTALYRFATPEQYKLLLRLSNEGKLTERAFLRNTTSLLPYVASVYGWDLKNYKQREKAQRIAEEERKRHEKRNAA